MRDEFVCFHMVESQKSLKRRPISSLILLFLLAGNNNLVLSLWRCLYKQHHAIFHLSIFAYPALRVAGLLEPIPAILEWRQGAQCSPSGTHMHPV